MDKKLEGNRKCRKRLINPKSEKGYLMLSTLFLLMLTGVFTQSVIKISANHIIQLNQVSLAYQAKTALNLAEESLENYIIDNDKLPETGQISSSVGNIEVEKTSKDEYKFILTEEKGTQYSKKVKMRNYEKETNKKKSQDLENRHGLIEKPVEKNCQK